jgi:hypothetical protein
MLGDIWYNDISIFPIYMQGPLFHWCLLKKVFPTLCSRFCHELFRHRLLTGDLIRLKALHSGCRMKARHIYRCPFLSWHFISSTRNDFVDKNVLGRQKWMISSTKNVLSTTFHQLFINFSSTFHHFFHQLFSIFSSTFYHFFINFLSTFHQLFIIFSSTFQQLFINFSSTFSSTFHQLFSIFSSTFHQLFINFYWQNKKFKSVASRAVKLRTFTIKLFTVVINYVLL